MIFSAPSVLRRRILRLAMISGVTLAVALAVDLSLGILINPTFSTSFTLLKAMHKPRGTLGEVTPAKHTPTLSPATTPAPAKAHPATSEKAKPAADLRAAFATKSLLRTAFLVSDDTESVEDFLQHADQLDAVFPTAFHVAKADGTLQQAITAETASSLFKGKNLVLPVVSNTDANGDWQPNAMAFLLDDPAAGTQLIQHLKDAVTGMNADGINIDFEQLSESETGNFNQWIKHLAETFHAVGLLVTVDIPTNDEAYDAEFLGEHADAVVAMVYDEHFASSKPGSVAGQAWFSDAVEGIAGRVPPQKLIIALGAYGYDWNLTANSAPTALSFEEAMFLAVDTQAEIVADGESVNPHFKYEDDDQQQHEVWFLDAVTAWNQFNVARSSKARGYSLWRTGMEDPGIWGFLGDEPEKFDLTGLDLVKAAPSVHFLGNGELIRVTSVPSDGERYTSIDDRLVDWEKYHALPSYYEVDRLGHSSEKRIALTFDDGPAPTWTPEILKILKKENVQAAFFVVGDEAQKNPDLLKSEFDQGHLIGNHTFFHPNIQELSDDRLRIEINATERVIESVTQHQAKLFRAPFDTDTSPTEAAQLGPLHAVDQMGLIVVGGDIDSDDYAKPGSATIVNNVLKELKPDGPNIVVMHDGGGDRHQTVEALAKLIPILKQQGYTFVSLNQLLGVVPQDLMPITSGKDAIVDAGQSVFTYLRTKGWMALQVLFYLTTAISVLRILFLGVFVRRSKSGDAKSTTPFTPPVTVLVPAFNESKVIRRTLDGLLRVPYPNLEILVVDDGSTDDTVEIASSYAATDPRVRVISKSNGGKWSALNLGFLDTDREYVVTIDADTMIPPGTIYALIAPFRDPAVDAVCGNVQVGNVHNVLTAFQDVEYVTTQNYDRRAFNSLNCISVVPGATGAWKRAAVLNAGAYSNETLTEDADLTLTLLEKGARIVYAPDARSVTEAPETVSALFKQRFRWSFGTFQCLWKHRKSAFKGTLGWVAIPNLFLFQVVYPLLSPIGDAVFALSLLRGDFGAIACGYGLFLLMDLAASIVAFRLDHRSMGTLWVVLIQRFFYRQFMYVVAFKAVIHAFRGGRQVWNKLDRNASVVLPEGYEAA